MRSLFLFNNFHDCMFFIGLYDFRWSLSGRYFFCVLQNPSLLPPSTRSTTTNDNFPQALGPTSCIVVVFSVTTTKADIHRIYSFRLFWQLPWTNRTGEPEEWCNVGPSVLTPSLLFWTRPGRVLGCLVGLCAAFYSFSHQTTFFSLFSALRVNFCA